MTERVAHIVQFVGRQVEKSSAHSVAVGMNQLGMPAGFVYGPSDALITRARAQAATVFLEMPSMGDVLVFLDDDISFGPEALPLLIRSCLERESIACGLYVVRSTTDPHPACALLPGQRVEIRAPGDLTKIQWGATGFMAIHRKVIERMAETLPYVFSGPRWFYPFFDTLITEEGEYLSEDFAFCERAKDLGFDTWLHTGIKLRHEGTRSYGIEDLEADAFRQTVTLTVNEGGPDETHLVEDLCGFLSKTRKEVVEWLRSENGRLPLSEEWLARNPQTPEDVLRFYEETQGYLLDLAQFNLNPRYWSRILPAMKATGKVLDFGAGLGTLSLQLASARNDVTYVDPGRHVAGFAAWRFAHRGLEIPMFSRLDQVSGDGSFDAIVATDVLEHIHPQAIGEVAAEFARLLKPNGQLIHVSDFHQDEGIEQHYETEALWTEHLQAAFDKESEVRWRKKALQPVG